MLKRHHLRELVNHRKCVWEDISKNLKFENVEKFAFLLDFKNKLRFCITVHVFKSFYKHYILNRTF